MKFFLMFLWPIVLAFYQNDYNVEIERTELLKYNKHFVSNVKVNYYFHTRSERRLNISATLLRDLGSNLLYILKAYKFLSNEYREFPMVYKSNPCTDMKQNLFGLDIKNFETNITMCPFKKGFYYLTNLVLNQSVFPPHAPRGRFMMQSEVLFNGNISLGLSQVYIKVFPTNPLEKGIF